MRLLADASAEGAGSWIIAVPVLILILIAAMAPDDDTPRIPRRKVFIRHAWEKMLREEECEGVRPERRGRTATESTRSSGSERPEPQAKWSDRR